MTREGFIQQCSRLGYDVEKSKWMRQPALLAFFERQEDCVGAPPIAGVPPYAFVKYLMCVYLLEDEKYVECRTLSDIQ